MIQAGGEQLVRQIHLLCNKAWNESTIPEEWSKSILIPIPKKGDLSQCANYRTISLINHTGKILLVVLLNRLKQQLEPRDAPVRSDWVPVRLGIQSDWVPVRLGIQSDWVPVRLGTGPTGYPVPTGTQSDWVPSPDWVTGPTGSPLLINI